MLQFILVFGVWGYHGTTFYVAVLPNLVICRFVPYFFKNMKWMNLMVLGTPKTNDSMDRVNYYLVIYEFVGPREDIANPGARKLGRGRTS